MTPTPHPVVAEDRQSLWPMTIPPAIWAIHFLATYTGVAIWCGKAGRHSSLGFLTVGFIALTALALAGIAAAGWRGWQRYQHGQVVPSHHKDTPEDRHRFLGLATVLLAGLSATAVLYAALAIAVIKGCS